MAQSIAPSPSQKVVAEATSLCPQSDVSYLSPSGFSPKLKSAVLTPRMSQSECAR